MNDWRNTLLPAVLPTVDLSGSDRLSARPGNGDSVRRDHGCMLFVAGLDLRYLGYAFVASLLPLYFLIFHVAYRRDRILAFLNPYSDPQGRGFHIIQSLIAVSTGGITGVGLMEGKQKLFYLPEPHTDFIFAVTAEELGLVGALVIVLLVRHLLVARNSHRPATRRTCLGAFSRWDHQHGRGAGLHQHQRGAGDDAYQGNSAAALSLMGARLCSSRWPAWGSC